jgi:OmcA/MtrC family decaheme c-type cytochrome
MRSWPTLFPILFLVSGLPSVHAQNSARGLKAEITGVAIPASRRPLVTFKVSDAKGKSLDLDDLDPNSVMFTIAAVKVGKSGESDYQNYILTKAAGKEYVYKGETRKPALAESLQPDVDQGGALTRARPGVLTYAFKTALPANFDQRAPHVVGGEMSAENRRYVANPVYSFVPAGGKVQASRSVSETATCNNCHDPLKAHGGARVETAYCTLCHTSQLTDPETGENLDFKYFIHKIHRGKYLPSVQAGKPYFTVGVTQRVFDFSTIVSPQSAVTESIRKEYRNCAACHANPKVTQWKTLPSSVGCISCHDDVDLRTGKKHSPGPAAEGTCVNCHQPEGPEFEPSIAGAHTFPGNAAQLPGMVFDILKIEGGKPGKMARRSTPVR